MPKTEKTLLFVNSATVGNIDKSIVKIKDMRKVSSHEMRFINDASMKSVSKFKKSKDDRDLSQFGY